jgi:hypothetical protein
MAYHIIGRNWDGVLKRLEARLPRTMRVNLINVMRLNEAGQYL